MSAPDLGFSLLPPIRFYWLSTQDWGVAERYNKPGAGSSERMSLVRYSLPGDEPPGYSSSTVSLDLFWISAFIKCASTIDSPGLS